MKYDKIYQSVDDYVSSQPAGISEKLQSLRAVIKQEAPEAQELISYNMPAYKLKGVLLYFGVHSHHIGFYPTPSAIDKFSKALAAYQTSKGAIQFPAEDPLPLELVSKIVRFRVKENLEKAKSKALDKQAQKKKK